MNQDTLLDELLSRWQEQRLHGRDVTAADLCADRPELLPEVQRRLDALRRMEGLLETQDPAATSDLAPSAPAAPAPVSVPGYEILGELGRGGMGVVYKARQTALKRLVALKVILSAGQAAPGERTRFRVEAEAVARLQHPNIVQIHEVGEQAGAPFCVLEFVDGGSLAQKLEKQRFAPEEAARLAETLARAMHYAHHEGKVLHRDLKPANVLLTGAGEPKITDFGLAKHLDDDSGQTRTGDVMGTPSYMAPEQAAGDLKAVGPRTDVYALGAVLYELLTGRPPFKGPNVAVTLQQVQGQDATPPTKLNPKTPRALETICLKCLAKDPTRRYTSALQLAQDLERFRGGEPILARPDGLTSKVWRQVRRQRVLLVACLLATLALTVAGFAALAARSAKQESLLESAIQDALASEEWTPARFEAVEGQIRDLEPLAPDQAAGFHSRLLERYRQSLLKALDAPRLDAADQARIERDAQALEARSPQAAKEIRDKLQERLRGWETVAELAAPFANQGQVFPPGGVSNLGAFLTAVVDRPNPKPDEPPDDALATTIPCGGNVQAEAVFDAPQGLPRELGLLLRAGPSGAGYAFVVSGASQSAGAPASPPLMKILRNGVLQRQQLIDVPPGPVTLRASQDGERLTFQVNQEPPMEFLDAFPLGDSPGVVYGLRWPAGARLTRLVLRRRLLPPSPSPLERADQLFDAGRFEEALAVYQRPARAAGPAEAALESHYKAALCLQSLNRKEEAGRGFEQVAGAAGDRWPPLAACRLLLLRLQQEAGTDAAEAVFESLAGRYTFEQLAPLLPENARRLILQKYHSATVRYGLPGALAVTERASQLADLFSNSSLERMDFKRELIESYWIQGKVDKALQVAEKALQECRALPEGQRIAVAEPLKLYCRLLRTKGEAARAREEMDRWLYARPGQVAKVSFHHAGVTHMLTVRVSLDVALNDWDQADRDVAECIRWITTNQVDYLSFADAYLMQGFLCERRGDRAAAVRAWHNGTWKAWLTYGAEGGNNSGTARPRPTAPYMIVYSLMIAALADELSDEEAQGLIDDFLADADSSLAAGVAALQVPAAAFRTMWLSPRGREGARQMAFHELPFSDEIRIPGLLLGLAVVREQAVGAELSAEQEALVWRLGEDANTFVAGEKLNKVQLLQLALAWKGVSGFLGWGSVQAALPASIRGPGAYILGFRYLKLNRPKDAETFFRTAVADAPADSPLRRLAGAALERLKKP